MTLLAVLLAAALGQAAGAQEETPQTIYDPMVPQPIWVSAKLAEQRGITDPDLFHPMVTDQISYILSLAPVAGCYEAGPEIADFVGGRRAPRALEEAARSYPLVAYGVVKELTPGFAWGEPGYLVRTEVSEISRGIALGQSFFIFIPVGDFTFAGKKICKEDMRYVGLPAVGDELLTFVDESRTKDVLYFSIDYPQAVILISRGNVRLPRRLPGEDSSGFESIEGPRSREELLGLLPTLVSTAYEGRQP